MAAGTSRSRPAGAAPEAGDLQPTVPQTPDIGGEPAPLTRVERLEALRRRLELDIAREQQAAARRVIAQCGGVICAHDLARMTIHSSADALELWWWRDYAEPCWECRTDMADDDEPLAVYRSGGIAVTCHLACFNDDDPEGMHDADPWDLDRWGDQYPDERWCLGCEREFTVMQPIPGPRRRFCTEACYWRHRNTEVRRRPRVTHSCRYCGDEFTGRADALTCSAACRQAMHREFAAVTP